MKAWFVYTLDGKKIGVFVNSSEEGEILLRNHYGNEVNIDFVGIDLFGKLQPYERLRLGMSSVDAVISSGILKAISRLH